MTDGRVPIAGPANGPSRPAASRADLVGMVLGGAIPVVAVALGCAVDPPIEMLIVAGIVGIPLGIVFGSVYGVEARAADGTAAFDLALRMAVRAVVAGDLVLGAIITIGLGIGGLYAVLLGIVATFIGLIILGLPALAFTIVCTLAWIAILRALPDRLVGDDPLSAT
jgi:hypothetical protein